MLAGFTSCETNYFVSELTKVEAITNCQIQIQRLLKSPRSMDIKMGNAHYLTPPEKPNHEVWFQFYAENSFGGESKHTAICVFNNQGNIIESRFE